jgi:hypothetical protein
MELDIKFKTPGQYLSMDSLQGVIRTINREIELGIYDTLVNEYPNVSRSLLKKAVKNKVDLNLKDAKKGSWEIELIGSVGAIIAGALISDFIVSTETWQETKKKIYSISERTVVNVKNRLSRKNRIGPFDSGDKSINISKKNNGVSKLELKVDLKRRNSNDLDFDMEKEVDRAIEEMRNRNNKTNK